MKKSVLFTSLLVLSSLALAACGGGSDDKGASNGGSDNQVYTMVESQECLVPIRPLRQMK